MVFGLSPAPHHTLKLLAGELMFSSANSPSMKPHLVGPRPETQTHFPDPGGGERKREGEERGAKLWPH